MKEKRSSFADKMKRHIHNRKEREANKSHGYLKLPKDIKTLSLEDDVHKIKVDFMMYGVTDKRHPDRDDPDVAVEGSAWWSRPFLVHREVGPNTDTVVCPTSIGKKCPICEYRVKRIKEGADKEEFKKFYPKPRRLYIVNVLEVKRKGSDKWEEFEESGVPFVWDMSTKLFQEILDETLEESPENMCFPNFEDGKTAILTLKWEKLGKTSYPDVRHIDFEDRDPYDEKLIEQMPNLDELLVILPYKDIEDKFFEVDEEDAGSLRPASDNEEEETPEETPQQEGRSLLRRGKYAGGEKEKETPEPKPALKRGLRTSAPEPAPEPERTPASTPKRSLSPKKETSSPRSSGSERCEYGHRFGEDSMKFEECENECSIWRDCMKEKERNEK